MKAAVFYDDGTVRVEERPRPEVGPGEVLLKVLACGVCGTDLRIQSGEFLADAYPVLAGHEISARVEQVGEGVEHVAVGDLVAINPNMSCGVCYACLRGWPHLCPDMTAIGVQLPGGFAEYLVAPARQALVMPPDLPPEVAAMLEPTSCCLHGLDQTGLRPGDPTVILGGGSIGLILLQLARHGGAAPLVLVELREDKRRLAEQLGADAVLDPSGLSPEELARAVAELTGGGAQVVIE
ncbi:MAG: alcohol dehydrogenase catalytic domain-containing protein, partial [Armatimonadetes bacterium]|nr:alcohol dehydrogenase catalytic domain-containing protein [Armatimonadota bacterium]